MKISALLIAIIFFSCNTNEPTQEKNKPEVPAPKPSIDSPQIPLPPVDNTKTYSNQRFKDVTITRQGDNEFLVKGKAQIFEASFLWVIEDGHNEINSGQAMTDAGAPEWGNFSFTVKAPSLQNRTLHLILFEISMKDGSRQHLLPIPLN